MAKIFEFPKEISSKKESREIKPTVRLAETAETIKRVVDAIFRNRLEEENAIIDMEALKDIFSMFSVEEGEMVDWLGMAESEGKITRNDKILLFSIFLTFKENNFQDVMHSIKEGLVTEKMLENMHTEIKSYLLKIFQKAKS